MNHIQALFIRVPYIIVIFEEIKLIPQYEALICRMTLIQRKLE